MSTQFTPDTLVQAISNLFVLNGYEVTGSFQIHGAQVDLRAKSRRDPFAAEIYVEATVGYVDNDKYGKDVGKLALLQKKDPSARCMIVSSNGFTDAVRERAKETGYLPLTYDELFAKFEQFDTFIQYVLKQADSNGPLSTLVRIYEEPSFHDKLGTGQATEYLSRWRTDTSPENRWLIVTGDYGTGKTALTKILEYRWVEEYRANPMLPIPFRIELRNFTRQFDARGLLHHFLDHSRLGHISIEFVESLIKQGRVVLLLDGYDEMAQYMHFRERRICLEALAALAADGAKGILTSRPNYFSEAEELSVFEALYSSLPGGGPHAHPLRPCCN